MQVSWIDPEEVASLADALRPTRVQPPAPPAPEPVVEEPVQPLLSESPADPADLPPVTPEPEQMPNLAAFRQRLQSIREKAIHAGLLNPQAAAVSAPAPAPAAPSAPVVETPAPVVKPVSAPEPEPEPVEESPVAAEEPSAEVSAPAPAPEETPAAEVSYEAAPPPAPAPAPSLSQEPAYYRPEPAVYVPSGASVKERLDAYASWAQATWSPNQLLIVDEFGDLLWGPPKRAGLVLSTMMAWNAAIRASGQAASGFSQVQHQTLATGEALAVIPCQTRLGSLHLAIVKHQAPWDQEIESLREALLQVMDTAAA